MASHGRMGTAAPRRLVIKPLKTTPRLPDNFELATWAKLLAAVRAVHAKRPVTHSLEELYRGVEDMCLQSMAARTYERLEAECEAHIQASVEALRGQTPDARAFLSLMHGCWTSHCEEMLTLRSIFLYLDRTHVMQTAGKKSLWDMGLASFRRNLSARPDVTAKLRGGLLSLIEAERNGDAVQRSLLSDLLRMLYDLNLYQHQFEEAFLAATTAFYRAEGSAKLHALDVPSLLLHIKARLASEEQRVSHYLHVSSRKPLIAAVRQMLLAAHVPAILEKGFSSLLDQARIEDLGRMYILFAQVDALPPLRHALSTYIKRVGTVLVSDVERERVLVVELLALKAKLDTVLATAFQGNDLFANTLKEAFEQFINVRQNRPAELLARHLDTQLRAGNKGLGEDELENSLDKAMTLFRYIDGKDMFEAFYKKDLSKRLLLDKSASIDAEKSMISKLKAECGSAFTSKLEGMFKDIDLSRDVMSSFRASVQAAEVPPSVELSVHVLTQGYWPSYPPVEVNLPREILQLQTIFSSFYMSKHNGRRLLWHPYLGHCTLRANFPLGRKEMAVSLLQTIVLLLFNDGDNLSYPHLLQATGIEDKELKITLQSLACGKVRALRKEPKGRNVDETDFFFFDNSFKHPLFRIKVNSIQMRETEAETEQTSERVFQDRQYQIDAAIVRVMKARKTLSHSILMAELFQQLKFPMKPADLKKRIESLIDREYLERDPTSASTYRYLA